MTKTAINHEIAALHLALQERGITLKRSDVTEAVAKAKGFRNSHAMLAQETKAPEVPKEETAGQFFGTTGPADETDLDLIITERDELRSQIESLKNISFFDWPSWRKSVNGLIKHSHLGKDPISDEALEKFRLAVTSNTSKSSSSERSSAEYSVMELAKRFGPNILARIDAAEEAAGKGLKIESPLIEKIKSLYEVSATRDGHSFNGYFYHSNDDEDPDHVGIMQMAKAMSIDDQYEDEEDIDERMDSLRSEFDTFDCYPATITLDISKMADALSKGEAGVEVLKQIHKVAELSGIDPRSLAGVIYPEFEG